MWQCDCFQILSGFSKVSLPNSSLAIDRQSDGKLFPTGKEPIVTRKRQSRSLLFEEPGLQKTQSAEHRLFPLTLCCWQSSLERLHQSPPRFKACAPYHAVRCAIDLGQRNGRRFIFVGARRKLAGRASNAFGSFRGANAFTRDDASAGCGSTISTRFKLFNQFDVGCPARLLVRADGII